MVAKFRERLAVSKQTAKKSDVERFNLRKVSELEVRKQYQIDVMNRCATLESLDDSQDINMAWEDFKGNLKT